ncbi:MAG TPA: pyruvate kinase [Paenibacillaceae bacterium]|nr:pyruvate kinase [Paenibacillaceae bacterium]
MRKTKIVCTIGPASESVEILKQLIEEGMNVARLNFSHGNHEEHRARINAIRQAASEAGKSVAILLDTKGPEIRTGDLEVDSVELKDGEVLILTTELIPGNEKRVSITYPSLVNDVKPGNTILIDDGLIGLTVEEIQGQNIICRIHNGGTLKSKKGVNVPGVEINLPGITEKDAKDIEFGIENGVDFIAASFVRKGSDVLEIRRILEDHGADIQIISKIENQEGVDNINEIIGASDGIMVARGDLGVEIQTEEIPIIQKSIIRKCNKAGKPVITATQMLDSMMRNPRPTRAEVTDVANAILDGTDAIMLSGETAAGKYPIEAVKTMYSIAARTEASLDYKQLLQIKSLGRDISTTNAISRATCTTAQDLGASAIVTATSSGFTARAVSKFRPKAPIIAATTSKQVMRQLSLVWGVYPVLSLKSNSTDEVIDLSIHSALESGFIKQGDLIVITAGIPVGVSGTTNLIKVHTVGEILLKGTGIGKEAVTGRVCVGDSQEELESKFQEGDILVSSSTDRDIIEFMKKASAIITEQGGLTSHAAIVGLSLEKPTIVGVEDATNILQDGEIVTADSLTGAIYRGEARVL